MEFGNASFDSAFITWIDKCFIVINYFPFYDESWPFYEIKLLMVLQFYILSLGKILCMKFQQKQLHIRHKNCPSVMICFNFIYSIILWTVTLILHFVEKKRPTAVLPLLASIKLLAPSTVKQHINSLDLLSFHKVC